jgi:hypothetical protein
MTDPFSPTRAPRVEPPTDVFEDAEEGDAEKEEAPATAEEAKEVLDKAEKEIESQFAQWTKVIKNNLGDLMTVAKKAIDSDKPIAFKIGGKPFTMTLELAKHIWSHVYQPEATWFGAAVGFITGVLTIGADGALNYAHDAVLRSSKVQNLNATIRTVTFGSMSLPSPEMASGTPSDRWDNAVWMLLTTGFGLAGGFATGAINKPLFGMIRANAGFSRQEARIPPAAEIQELRELVVAIRQDREQPQGVEVQLQLANLAREMLREVREMRLERVHQMPALPFGINPVRLPQGQRLALADDDRPRGRLALTDDDIPRGRLALTDAPRRRLNPMTLRDLDEVRAYMEREEAEERALEAARRVDRATDAARDRRRAEIAAFGANARPKAETRSRIDPVSLRDLRLVREYAEQEEAAGAGKRGRGKPKHKAKTKEVLNIPPPILEYFDVKNDPHFIRAHRPTAPK